MKDVCVLITRPAGQGDSLAEAVQRLGAQPLLFPAFEIEPAGKRAQGGFAPLRQLSRYDLIIFVSVNAVRYALAYLKPLRLTLPPVLPVAAVGAGTARELTRELRRDVLHPSSGTGSEALLEMPALAGIKGRRVLIVRGEGGREFLADGLRARGAQVDYAEIYRRTPPKTPLQLTPGPQPWVVLVSSEEALANLKGAATAESLPQLLAATLIVSSERLAEAATKLGYTGRILPAKDASDEGLLAALRTLGS